MATEHVGAFADAAIDLRDRELLVLREAMDERKKLGIDAGCKAHPPTVPGPVSRVCVEFAPPFEFVLSQHKRRGPGVSRALGSCGAPWRPISRRAGCRPRGLPRPRRLRGSRACPHPA